ncbi:helix-turn-helix domain-containing protein [Bacillus sonorensis]|uniref:HTH-type transcriptional regulator n=2 Tax=Bacillus sonorensis TaxID=119858 RepID=M5PCI5_9BACI|nr:MULTISPECIES: helix-turn-helix domain-containing protein [Bacillus]TWK77137.1 putative HTH-type transcriptional regulator YybR [Bacillus paralicheniformis]ASB87562.1 putative HTH-type transcriptional regulator YtcD [Bacillus sonorensis]EME72922.1 HTH-type transcriptional regulator [Bacillus sonorensis L12]MBG9916344.1 MarR family transcriptional regulator [Bacillus sonorensis]MCF7617016.1 helix-turn-helix transcriptional regulator [Bacillus sonorensis]
MKKHAADCTAPGGYSCPVEATIDIIGGKWKSVILFHLIDGKKRFNELRRLIPGVTQRMLTLQLRELERDGIVHREIYKQVPPKVEYCLTEFGKTLIPIINQMMNWGMSHAGKIDEARRKSAAAE